MVSSFSPYISLFLYVSISLADAEAKSAHNLLQNSNFRFFEEHAQRFYRELGLSPTLEANNMVEDDPLVKPSKIVEKSFRFPSLSDYGTANSTVQEFAHHAGYFSVDRTHGARMFYYFFEARQNKAKAPVVVWLSGGPGCSGSLALFYENGPFHFTKNLSLVWNDYGWDQEANLLYIDQPIGTGFSYYANESDIPTTSEAAAVDFYDFLQAFFESHREYAKNNLYITGESYAGHYIPAFAARVHQCNKNKQRTYINLKGMAIGNGLTNPGIQYKAYPIYALKMKLINHSHYDYLMTHQVSTCQYELPKACDGTNNSACAEAYNDCYLILYDILDSNEGRNPYDIRKPCIGTPLCYDFSNVKRFLNQASVKKALGVGDREFDTCSLRVLNKMGGDMMRNYGVYIPELLGDGIKLLVYAGEYDLICNWLGNWMWVVEMKWCGQNGFRVARNVTFEVDGVTAGWLKSYGPLTLLTVKDAGHLVPMDQPKASLEMLRKWMHGCLL